jgi:hypothetical protein
MTTKLTTSINACRRLAILLALLFSPLPMVLAQTNNVTGGNGTSYTINGQADPAFTFQRGVTYVFQLSGVSFHPFWIKSVLGGFNSQGAGAFNNGVANNGATSGSVSFTVPTDAPDQLFYQCGVHTGMSGVLTITTPPSPPTVNIVYVNVADFVTLKSTGTNGWSAVPEFRCGLDSTNWIAVANFTNSLANGTNTTTFPRLEAVCGSTNVLLRVRNQQP